MILAFANDFTVVACEDVPQANDCCEGVDVEDGNWIFTDERGNVLVPRFTSPSSARKRLFGFPFGTSPRTFDLERTEEKRLDLILAFKKGQINVCLGPAAISREDILDAIFQRPHRH